MLDLSSDELLIFQELKSREARDSFARMAFGLLVSVAGDAQSYLDSMTSADRAANLGRRRAFLILHRLFKILPEQARKELSSVEIFALIIACIFHDGATEFDAHGGGKGTGEDAYQRNKIFISSYFDSKLRIIADDSPRLKNSVSFVAGCHHLSWEDMANAPEFKNANSVQDQELRCDILATLLRVGNLLDFETERSFDTPTKDYVGSEIDLHAVRPRRKKQIERAHFDPSLIDVLVRPDDRIDHQIWYHWFGRLAQVIEKGNTYVFSGNKKSFTLPKPSLKIDPAEGASYDVWPLRFVLDHSGRVLDLISRSIYTRELDFLRELLQNAIDAGLATIFLSEKATMPHASPRTWTVEGYEAVVVLVFDEETQILEVHDNGIGMDRSQLEKFLFTVAGSGFTEVRNSRSERQFPAIAQFGIGFVSVLTRSSSFTVDTRPCTENLGRRVLREEGMGEAYVEIVRKICCGTSISVKLRHHLTTAALMTYVRENFRFTSTKIRILNVKALRDVIQMIASLGLKTQVSRFETLSSDPFLVNDCTNTDDLEKMSSEAVGIVRTEVQRLRSHYNLSGLNSGGLGPTISRLQRADPPEENRAEKLSRQEVAQLRDPQQPFVMIANEFERDTLESVLAMVLADDFSVIRIYREVQERLPRAARYLLFVPVYYIDYSLGVEWQSLHGVLVDQGQVKDHLNYPGRRGGTAVDDPVLRVLCDDILITDYDVEGDSEVRRQGLSIMSKRGWDLGGRRRIGHIDDDDESDITFLNSAFGDVVQSMTVLGNRSYQDGILIPVPAWEIAPVGASRAVCNLTGSARFVLNVTRNSIDESPDILELWWRRVGVKIQEVVIDTVRLALDRQGITLTADIVNGDVMARGSSAFLDRSRENLKARLF